MKKRTIVTIILTLLLSVMVSSCYKKDETMNAPVIDDSNTQTTAESEWIKVFKLTEESIMQSYSFFKVYIETYDYSLFASNFKIGSIDFVQLGRIDKAGLLATWEIPMEDDVRIVIYIINSDLEIFLLLT